MNSQTTTPTDVSVSINGGVGSYVGQNGTAYVVEGKGWGWTITPAAEYVAPAPKPSRAELKHRWEAAQQFLAKMQTAYERGEISFEAMDAADVAECDAYNAYHAA